MRYLLNLSYDGSKFFGFQRQNDKPTVALELEKSLSVIFNEKVKIVSSSRTDRGVHAYNQYVHFNSIKEVELSKLKHSLNSMINKYIYIKKIEKVDDNFHSRYDVKSKEYLYKINQNEYNPIEKDYILQYNKQLNFRVLKKACTKLKGTHNFKSFTSDNEKDNYIRKVEYIKIKRCGGYVYIYISATGFLRYMVRNIIGLLLEINEGRKKVEDIGNIFKAEDRRENAITAPGQGLYLNKIEFK